MRIRYVLEMPRGVVAIGLAAAMAIGGCGGDGKDGAPGGNGDPGKNGDPGTAGMNGSNGSNGSNGTNGMNGNNGSNGSSRSLSFTPVNVALSASEKQAVYASGKAIVDGSEVAIGYTAELRTGQMLGTNVFGTLVKKDGTAIVGTDTKPVISNYVDFSSMLKVGSKIFEITHFETTPAAMYLTELTQDAAGKLTAVSTKPIDFQGVEGLWTPCAGSVSPWNTHLGSEEYPPDAKNYADATAGTSLSGEEQAMLRYWSLDATAPIATIKAAYNPYRYGYIVEVGVDATGAATVKKHYAAGRRALELSYVMPDQKTVYMSDDGANDGFYMFIAKTAGDLSEGRLYAARWFQTSPAGAPNGRADIYWIPLDQPVSATDPTLRTAKDSEIKALIDAGTKFTDIFDLPTQAQAADGTCPTGYTPVNNDPIHVCVMKGQLPDGTCPTGYTPINVDTGRECLKVKTGMELAASRLESRRYAAYVGATTEFRKSEGITFNVDTNRLYMSYSELNRGMTNDPTNYDLGGLNHVKVAKNDCGGVYEFVVSPNAQIGSDYVIESAASLIEGVSLKDPANSFYPNTSPYFDPSAKIGGKTITTNTCSVNGIANPDNISFVTGYDTLLIGEDTTDGHQNDVVWAYNIVTRELTRIFSTPYGAETTGVYWYPNLNGHAYIKAQVQHPYGESDEEKSPDATAKAGYVGYIGPLPAMDK
jgi:secreted PhoX family phosphatase